MPARLPSLPRIIVVSNEQPEHTIARWNDGCTAPGDDDFARPEKSMMPIGEPPYYVGKVWPLVNNTQGGPVHDAQQRVLNAYGEPVNGLYAAGELGSVSVTYIFQVATSLSVLLVGALRAVKPPHLQQEGSQDDQ